VRRVRRLALQRTDDHRLDPFVAHRPGRTRAGLVAQPLGALLGEAAAPLGNRRDIQVQSGGHRLVLLSFGTGQHDAGPLCQGLGRAAPGGQPREFGKLRLGQLQRNCPTSRLALPDTTGSLASYQQSVQR
jgi:hypothetical protein